MSTTADKVVDSALPWHADSWARLTAERQALPHALLIKGPRGIGKLAFARALSQLLLCEAEGTLTQACGTCSSCTWFTGGSHPDFQLIEPIVDDTGDDEEGGKKGARKSAWIKVDAIRALADFLALTSHRGTAKLILIHPAEALNVAAANALLKNLEEPPPRTVFMLVTHRPSQLLPTLRSRCQQIALAPPDLATGSTWLQTQGVKDAALALAHAGGTPLSAAELHAGDYWSSRAAFLRQITAQDLDVMRAAESLQDIPMPQIIGWLQKWTYDLAQLSAAGIVRYNPDYLEVLEKTVAKSDALQVLRFHRELVRMQRIAQHPLNARLFIEDLLFGYRDLLQPQTV